MLRGLLIGVVVLAAMVLVSRAGTVVLLLFAGALFAIFLNGAARWLTSKLHLPYPLALTLVALGLFASATGLSIWLGPRLVSQVSSLLEQVPDAARAVVGSARLHRWLHGMSRGEGQGLLRDMETAFATAKGVVTGGLAVVGGLVVFLFLGLYGAAQPAAYRHGLLRVVPLAARPRANEVVTTVVGSLRRWLLGRVIAMLFVGVATSLAFWALNIPVALALGLLAGVLSFVEYVGALASAAPALLLAANQGWSTVIWVVVLFTGVHAVEGYLLTPWLARKTVHFPPAFTLAVQIVFGVFFGLMGLILATPATVVITLIIQMLYVEDVLGDAPDTDV